MMMMMMTMTLMMMMMLFRRQIKTIDEIYFHQKGKQNEK
jgi:hypothetical protein